MLFGFWPVRCTSSCDCLCGTWSPLETNLHVFVCSTCPAGRLLLPPVQGARQPQHALCGPRLEDPHHRPQPGGFQFHRFHANNAHCEVHFVYCSTHSHRLQTQTVLHSIPLICRVWCTACAPRRRWLTAPSSTATTTTASSALVSSTSVDTVACFLWPRVARGRLRRIFSKAGAVSVWNV